MGRPGLPLVHPTPRQWYHEADGVKIPMPTASNLRLLEAEHVGKPWGSKHGPRATAFRASVVSWAAELVEKFRGDGSRVTGALGESIGRWDSRIAHMPAAERRDYRCMLTHGVDWPWLDGATREAVSLRWA